jgi:hypothetical protein
MPWTDIGGNYHWGDTPGWTAEPEPAPAPAPFVIPTITKRPPAPVAPPVAGPAPPPAPVEAIGPSISPGGPIVSKLQTGAQPLPSTGAVLAGTLLPPPSIWANQPQRPARTPGSISTTK